MPGKEEDNAKAEEKAKTCSLEILMKSGKWTRYQHKDYETAVAEAERIAAAIRAKKELFYRLYRGQFIRLSEIAFVGPVSWSYPSWH